MKGAGKSSFDDFVSLNCANIISNLMRKKSSFNKKLYQSLNYFLICLGLAERNYYYPVCAYDALEHLPELDKRNREIKPAAG